MDLQREGYGLLDSVKLGLLDLLISFVYPFMPCTSSRTVLVSLSLRAIFHFMVPIPGIVHHFSSSFRLRMPSIIES